MPRALAVPVALAALVAVPVAARAERRAFPHAYEYGTTTEGQTEVELHSAQASETWEVSRESFDFALELAHGITDRWDVSLYHRFRQTSPYDEFGLDTVALETRYRLAERGEWPADLAVIGSIDRGVGYGWYIGNVTAVVARDFGAVSMTANLRGKVTFGGTGVETVFAAGYAAGVSYELTPTWKLGAESWGESLVETLDGNGAWAGPAAAWAPSRRTWIAASAGFGLTKRADSFVVSTMIGLSL